MTIQCLQSGLGTNGFAKAPVGARAPFEEAFEEPQTRLNSIPGPLRAPAQRLWKYEDYEKQLIFNFV